MSNHHARAKSLTLDSLAHDDGKEKDIGKSFSFNPRPHERTNHNHKSALHDVDESKEYEEVESDQPINLDQLSNDVSKFINSLSADDCDSKQIESYASPKVTKFLEKVEIMIDVYESDDNPLTFGISYGKDSDLLGSINQVSALHTALDSSSSRSNPLIIQLLNETSVVLHRSMVFLEVEMWLLLDEALYRNSNNLGSKHWDSSLKNLKGRIQSFAAHPDLVIGGDSNQSQEKKTKVREESNDGIPFPSFTPECISNIGMVSNAMILGGHEAEYCIRFAIARKHAFEEELKKLGFDKVSVDDIQKLNWEPMEGEIVTWIRVFKYCFSDLIPSEQQFYELILLNHPTIRLSLLGDLACGVLSILLNFAEAIAMTKRSTEKLFKFLDMYETLRDSIASVKENKMDYPKQHAEEMRSKISFTQMVVGDAAISMFCQLETSIKADNNKTPVPNGAIHPLTRYTMNYLKYACEYKESLEEIFEQHNITEQDQEHYLMLNHAHKEKKPNHNAGGAIGVGQEDEKPTRFASQLMEVMALLDNNLDSKSKLYKDPSLRYIFLMNNGRYILQKVKGSEDITQVVGGNWIRKRSSDVRNYHKSYQRETWSKVLQCLNHEGLQVHGKVYKPYLKDRFKNFNQMFDEIQKTQISWVVSDDQLRSELRVSISAIMIPAYRSFVARFGQIFTPGRQTEKYIKYQPEDIEAAIEDLFDGNSSSMGKKR